jgi:ribosome maturation factor RimP
MDIVERVNGLIAEHLKQHDIELVEMTYKAQGGETVLRLLVDTPSGITVNECAELNTFLSEALDKEDIITGRYLLEVSSPGLDRPIRSERDFERAMGRELQVTTYEMIDQRKIHEGHLVGMDSEKIVLESGGISTVIPKVKIALARLKVEI